MELFRGTQPSVATPAAPSQKYAFARMCSDYSHLGGKPFKGSKSVLEVQTWLRASERIFSRMDLSDHHRVLVASSMLQERALDWYELFIAKVDESSLSWIQLKERFELKFVHESEKANLARSFLELKQGKSSVSDYVASFNALSKYGVEFINTPRKKNLRFVDGLKKYLKKVLLLQLKLSFEELVDSALCLEAVEKERDSGDNVEVSKNPNKKRFPFHKPNSSNHKKKKQATSSSQPSSAPSVQRVCYNCGSLDHFLHSCPKPRICRYCKKEGHRVSDCPIASKGFKSGKLNVA